MRYNLPGGDDIFVPAGGTNENTINEKRKSTILADTTSAVGEEDQISGNEEPTGVPIL